MVWRRFRLQSDGFRCMTKRHVSCNKFDARWKSLRRVILCLIAAKRIQHLLRRTEERKNCDPKQVANESRGAKFGIQRAVYGLENHPSGDAADTQGQVRVARQNKVDTNRSRRHTHTHVCSIGLLAKGICILFTTAPLNSRRKHRRTFDVKVVRSRPISTDAAAEPLWCETQTILSECCCSAFKPHLSDRLWASIMMLHLIILNAQCKSSNLFWLMPECSLKAAIPLQQILFIQSPPKAEKWTMKPIHGNHK